MIATSKNAAISIAGNCLDCKIGRLSLRSIRLRYFFALAFALGFAFTLSGCGLYQTKTAFVPYRAVAVTGSLSPELLYQLQFHILTFINIKVAIHPKDADLILEIIQEVPNSQILSYTGTGQVSAFGLTDAVTFRAVDLTGKVLIPQSEIYVVRDMNFSVSQVLSAEIQQQQMMTDMRKELAMQITRRLIALGRIGS
jgi:LPS-assembly lipoprotein